MSLLFNKVITKEVKHSVLDELSKRDLEILYYISKGMSNKEIGDHMFLSEKTIKNNITRIFRVIDARDRVQATIYAIEHKIAELYLNH